jgi:5-(carboxyamino)imidazole ribonucleotide synthase
VTAIGVIGGGQLARMMAHAATTLGCRLIVLAERFDTSAAGVCELVVGDWRDPDTVVGFAAACDVVTFDHELVPPPVLDALEACSTRIFPSPAGMRRAADKQTQRTVASSVGLPVLAHRVVSDPAELKRAVSELGLPVVAKRAGGGYDGRGLTWLRTRRDVAAFQAGGMTGEPVIIEPELDLTAELATTIARRRNGEHVLYPVVRTHQVDGICHTVTAPAMVARPIADTLHDALVAIAEALDHVGVLTIEAFLVDGQVYLNELAPRPHNSAHYTIDACTTSQFENHLRAILDLPLGDPTMIVPAAAMANVLGVHDGPTDLPSVDLPARTSVHLYGKHSRPGRKLGHVTVTGRDPAALERTARSVAERLAHTRRACPPALTEREQVIA